MANTFAMMLVMIGLSVFGRPELAANLGLVHDKDYELSLAGVVIFLLMVDKLFKLGAPQPYLCIIK